MKWKALSPAHTQVYKAIAILMIVIHNFMHWLPGPKEMEFSYSPNFFFYFISSTINEPEKAIQFTFSFIGHFGVQVFIFLSAYGLTKKYLKKQPSYTAFILSRARLIYPPFIIAILFWAFLKADYSFGILAPFKTIYWNLESIILKLTLLSNFIESERLSVVGPWWFISFIFQIYFIFPVLFYCNKRFGSQSLIIITVLSYALLILSNGVIGNVGLLFTVIGHLPEICIGIYLATRDYKDISISNYIVIASFGAFILGNINSSVWFLTHASFLILLLSLLQLGHNYLIKGKANKALRAIGAISMQLFLVNGFLRQPFVDLAKVHDDWIISLLYGLLSLSISVLVAIALLKAERVYKTCSDYFLKQPKPKSSN